MSQKITEFEILNHGLYHCAEFQGCKARDRKPAPTLAERIAAILADVAPGVYRWDGRTLTCIKADGSPASQGGAQ